MIKRGIGSIVGKTIKGVIVKRRIDPNETDITLQLMLVFSDNTFYELWENTYEALSSASRLDHGDIEAARRYSSDVMKVTYEVYLDETGHLIVDGEPV
jgi:hypothetical protein